MTLLTAGKPVITVRMSDTIFAFVTGRPTRTYTFAGLLIASRCRGAVALATIWKTVVADFAGGTLRTNNVFLAVTLSAELIAFKSTALSTDRIAETLRCAVVVVGGQRVCSMLTETGRIGINMKRIRTAFGNEMIRFIGFHRLQQFFQRLYR